MEDVKATVKAYILDEFLQGEDPANLNESTPLVTSGVLDSLATLKLISHLEATYGIEFQAHEMDAGNLNTISDIANLVRSKQQNG